MMTEINFDVLLSDYFNCTVEVEEDGIDNTCGSAPSDR